MNNQLTHFPSINGDRVVKFTNTKELKNFGWADRAKVSELLLDGENTHRKHLGLVELYATTHKRPMNVMRNMLQNAVVLSVKGNESITYDLPVHRERTNAVVAEDTSDKSEAPGIADTIFELVLSREFSPGSVLTYDPEFGQQCIVTDEIPVEQVGDNFRHFVKLMTFDKNESFNPAKLKVGVEYMRVTTVISEYDVKFPNINLEVAPQGTITNEFILGDPRAVETFYTQRAANLQASGLSKAVTETRNRALDKLESMVGSNNDMYFIGKPVRDAQGKLSVDPNNIAVGPALEYFVLAELALMEAQDLTWAKGGVVKTDFGTKRKNEGLYHQNRRGKIIKYSREGGLTLDHLMQAAHYVYRNVGPEVPVKDRIIRFKAGYYAWINVMQLFREEVRSQAANLPGFLFANDKTVEGSLFSGPLDALDMKAVMFRSVQIPGIGTIEVEHDETLDYMPMSDKMSKGFYGSKGVARTSFSLLIEDAGSAAASNVNVQKAVRGVSYDKAPGTVKSTTYYVKPEGSHVVFGYEQGRMAGEGGSTFNVPSVMKNMGKTFWAYSTSAALELDITKQVWIELEQYN